MEKEVGVRVYRSQHKVHLLCHKNRQKNRENSEYATLFIVAQYCAVAVYVGGIFFLFSLETLWSYENRLNKVSVEIKLARQIVNMFT